MDRADRFRELFAIWDGKSDPAMIPGLMRFGGFEAEDVSAVETASELSPRRFVLSFSSADAKEASEALAELSAEIPGIRPVIADMRKALGLETLRSAAGEDRASMLRDMISECGKESLSERSMRERGFPPEDCMMVGYMEKCCRKAFLRMAWDPDPCAARKASESVADATGLDIAELRSLMKDIRGDEPEEEKETAPDPGLSFRKIRPSEAAVYRYSGSEKTVEIPATVKINGKDMRVTAIADDAFARNGTLERISMPEGLETIGRFAFFGCGSLSDADLPKSLLSIGNGAFSRCGSLRSVRLPGKLESIGDQAFLGAPLERAFIPESVMRIGDHAFGPGTALSGKKTAIRRSAS